MEAKRLMIGDWVASNEFHRPHKITKSDFWGTDGSFGEFYPIKITETILMDNGFKYCELYVNDNHVIRYNNLKHVTVGYLAGGEYVTYVDIYAEYVHELQRILHACGLDDVADNFVVL